MTVGTSRLLLSIAVVALLSIGPSSQAGTPCLEAVFFDLGNTLVEDSGGGVFVLRTGAAQTISDLQANGVRLGIITNVPGSWDIDDLRAILAEPEFLDEFEVVILSSEAPASKPDPAIYTFAHGSLAAPRPDITATAFVGETLLEIANAEFNPTLGARSVGMTGIHLSDQAPSPLTDYTIPTDGLEQVVTIVEDTCMSTDVDDPTSGLDSRSLRVPHPNPSTGHTRIEFSISAEEHVTIGIFDAQGRRVVRLLEKDLGAGQHEVTWDGTDADGLAVPSGVYYSRMQAGDESYQVRMLKLK